MLKKIGSFPERLGTNLAFFSARHPWRASGIVVILLCGFLFFGWSVGVDNSYDAYFIPDDPSFVEYNTFNKTFGSDEFVYILYSPKDTSKDVLSPEVMEKIRLLSNELENIPFAEKVFSLTTRKFIVAKGDTLNLLDLDKIKKTFGQDFDVKKYLLNKTYINGNLLTSDSKYGAIFVEMNKTFLDQEENTQSYSATVSKHVAEIIARPEFKSLNLTAVGDPLINHVYNELNQNESTNLIIYSFILIALIILLIFRSFKNTLGVLLVIAMALLGSIAILGIMDWKMTLLFVILPSLILTVGVGDSIHLISEYIRNFKKFNDSEVALKKAVEEVSLPVFMTTFTTFVGFISLLVAPIRAIREFSIYASFGVLFAYFFTFLIIPILLRKKKIAKPDNSRKKEVIPDFLEKYVHKVVIAHPKKIIAMFLILTIVATIGITKIQIESNWIEEFSDDVPIKSAYLKVNKIIGGTGAFSLVLKGNKQSLYSPDFMNKVKEFQKYAESFKLVSKTLSITDFVMDINVALHEDNESFRRIPETYKLITQYLFLYEISGGDEDILDYINSDKTITQIGVRIRMGNLNELLEVFESLQEYAEKNFVKYNPRMTGISSLSAKMGSYIERGQLRGFLLAFIAISILMLLIFRSIKYSIISMIPNLIPIIVVLGTMGLLGIKLDYVKMLIACIAIGICVDDTIHMFTRFRNNFEETQDYINALRLTIRTLGVSVLSTSVILSLGFLINVISVMDSLKMFGLLTSFVIFIALISDLYLAPAMIISFKPLGKGNESIVNK